MNTDGNRRNNTELLHKDLSYNVRGAILSVSKKYGKGLKESVYQNALAEEFALEKFKLKFVEHPRVSIHSLETNKVLGYYIPDFIVEDKIVIEIKATDFTTNQNFEQQLSYLKASKYEVGFLVNFNTPQLYIKRLIFTNDRKPSQRLTV